MDNTRYTWHLALLYAAATAVSPLLLAAVMPAPLAMLLGPAAVAIPFFTMSALEHDLEHTA